MTDAAAGHSDWASRPVRERARILGGLRHDLARDPAPWLEALRIPSRQDDAESLSAEVLPLASACRWIEKRAARVLGPQRLGVRGRPLWLWGVGAEIRREPFGEVLVIGPGNFPLFLPGVQALQALAAGNRVRVKPAPGGEEAMRLLAEAWFARGLPRAALEVLDASVGAAEAALETADLVVLTGGERTGAAVRRRCAERGIPLVAELSGHDAVYVLEGADARLAADCVAYGVTLNGGATCIAPRRVFVAEVLRDAFLERLLGKLAAAAGAVVSGPAAAAADRLAAAAQRGGAVVTTAGPPGGDGMRPVVVVDPPPDAELHGADLFAPVVSVQALGGGPAPSRFGLGASVFGPRRAAEAWARRIDAGVVTVNDVVVPTADPRLPFGGRHASGYGVTRGPDGLLATTRTKSVSVRRRRVYPHLRATDAHTRPMLAALLGGLHGRGVAARVRHAADLLAVFRAQTRAGVGPGAGPKRASATPAPHRAKAPREGCYSEPHDQETRP